MGHIFHLFTVTAFLIEAFQLFWIIARWISCYLWNSCFELVFCWDQNWVFTI